MNFENKAPLAITLKGGIQRGFTELLLNYNVGSDVDMYGVVVWYKTQAQTKAQAQRLILPYSAGNSTDIKITGLLENTTYDISLALLDEFISSDLELVESQYQTDANLISIVEVSTTTRVIPSFVSVTNLVIESAKIWLPSTNITVVLAGSSDILELLLDNGSGYISYYKGKFSTSITLSAPEGTYSVKLIGSVEYFDGTEEVLVESIYGSTVSVTAPSFDMVESIGKLTVDKDQTYEALFDLTSKYAHFRFQQEQRLAHNDALIDATVFVDPDTGLIVNRAFAYTDTQFTSAQLSIDGLTATIVLQAESLDTTNSNIVFANSLIAINAEAITLRTTTTEVNNIIASELAALTPAYSWQFNQDAEGFTGNTNGTVVGFLVSTAAIGVTTPTISLDTSTDYIFRMRIKQHIAGTWDGIITFAGGSINVPAPLDEDVYEIITVDASNIGAYTGTITELVFDLGDVDIDYIEIGKRSVNDQAFEDISLRTTTIEQDMDSGTGRMSVYATSTSVTEAGYQTVTNVNTLIDTWQAIYSIETTMLSLDSNDTIQRATTANTWVDAADSNVGSIVATYNVDNGVPGTADMVVVDQRLDAAEGTISSQILAISGLSDNLSGIEEAALLIAYQQFLTVNQVEASDIKIAIADETLSATVDTQGAQASNLLTLDTRVGSSETALTVLTSAFSNETQATAVREIALETRMVTADGVVLADANEYTITTIGYCMDAQGNPVLAHSEDAVACENAGYTWNFGAALSESLKRTSITTTGGSATVEALMQTYETSTGELSARAALQVIVDPLDSNKRIIGGVYIDGSENAVDLRFVGDSVSFIAPDGSTKFKWDAATEKFLFVGTIQLVDDIEGGSYVVDKLSDIKAQDGLSTTSMSLTNPTHSIPASDTGVVSSYENAGTDIHVFYGDTELTYDGLGLTSGNYTASVLLATGISAGTISASGSFATISVPISMITDTASITILITGLTSEGNNFIISQTQTFSKSKDGKTPVDGTDFFSAISIDISNEATTVRTDAAGTVLDYLGTDSTIHVLDGTTQLTFSYLNAGGNDTWYATAVGAGITVGATSNPNTVSYKIGTSSNMTATATATITILIYIKRNDVLNVYTKVLTITKSFEGTASITMVLSNPTHALPSSATGVVSSYENAGTEIRVYNGDTELTYDGVGSNWGTYKTVVTADANISAGSISDSGFYGTLSVPSSMVANTAYIVLTSTGRTPAGANFSIVQTQTFSRADSGYSPIKEIDYFDSINIDLSRLAAIVPASSTGTVSSYANTGADLKVYNGNTIMTYSYLNSGGNGTWYATATGTNITRGSLSVTSNVWNMADASTMTDDTATITITIYIQRNNIVVQYSRELTITKSKTGEDGIDGIIPAPIEDAGTLAFNTTYLGFIDDTGVWRTYMDSDGDFLLSTISGEEGLRWNAGTGVLTINGNGTFSGSLSAATGSFGVGGQIQIDPVGIDLAGSSRTVSLLINNPYSGSSVGKSGIGILTSTIAGVGLISESTGSSGVGVEGKGTFGILGRTASSNGAAVSGRSTFSSTPAGNFINEVTNTSVNVANGYQGILVSNSDDSKVSIGVQGFVQGAGRVYVGQSGAYGGGIEYNGTAAHAAPSGGASDVISLFRRDLNVDYWVIQYAYHSNNIQVRGTVTESFSDLRLKNVKRTLDSQHSLNAVSSWEPIVYSARQDIEGFIEKDTQLQIGLSAQAVQLTHPELTPIAPFDRNSDGTSKSGKDYLTLQYARVAPVLVSAIQQLEKDNKSLEARLKVLEDFIAGI